METNIQFYHRLGIKHTGSEVMKRYQEWADKVIKDISGFLVGLRLKK